MFPPYSHYSRKGTCRLWHSSRDDERDMMSSREERGKEKHEGHEIRFRRGQRDIMSCTHTTEKDDGVFVFSGHDDTRRGKDKRHLTELEVKRDEDVAVHLSTMQSVSQIRAKTSPLALLDDVEEKEQYQRAKNSTRSFNSLFRTFSGKSNSINSYSFVVVVVV